MKEPQRWLLGNDAPEGSLELLRAGDPPPALSEPRRAELSAFAQGLATQGAIAATTGSLISTKLVLSGVAIGIAAAVGVITAVRWATPPPAASVQSAHRRPMAQSGGAPSSGAPRGPGSPAILPQAQGPVASPLTQSIAPIDPHPGASSRVRTTEISSHPTPTLPSPAPVASFDAAGISEEAALLERARSALQGAPARALALTEEHQRAFPSGQLADERELVAVDALQRLGRTQEARQRAAPALARADSPYARRMRRILGEPH